MLKVLRKRCDQCLFSKARIVSAERKAEVLRTCKRRDTHFVCHKTTDAVCHGFYATRTSNLIRIMGRLNGIEFIDVPEDAR